MKKLLCRYFGHLWGFSVYLRRETCVRCGESRS